MKDLSTCGIMVSTSDDFFCIAMSTGSSQIDTLSSSEPSDFPLASTPFLSTTLHLTLPATDRRIPTVNRVVS